MHFFWYLILVFLTTAILRLASTVQKGRKKFLSFLLMVVIQSWVMLSAMLHRPYNVVLLPIQLLFSIVIQAALKSYGKSATIVHAHYWLGNVFYFYQVCWLYNTDEKILLIYKLSIILLQGNSNNLSTIDVAAGYVGMESYNPYITGLFLIVNTYSAPVLAYFTLLYGIALENKNQWVPFRVVLNEKKMLRNT